MTILRDSRKLLLTVARDKHATSSENGTTPAGREKTVPGKAKKKTSTSAETDHRWKGKKQNAWKADGSGSPQGGVPGEGGQARDGRRGSRKLGCSTTLRFLTSWSIWSDLFWSFWWLWRRSGQPAKEKTAWTKQSLQTRLVWVFCNDPLSCPNWQESLVCFIDYFAEGQLMNFSPSPRAPTRQRMEKVIDKPKNRVPCSVSSVTCRAKLWARTLPPVQVCVCSGSLSCWCCSCLLGPVAPPLVSRRCSRPCSFIFCSMSSCLHFLQFEKNIFLFLYMFISSLFHFFIFSAAMRFPVAALASGFSLPTSLSATWRVPRSGLKILILGTFVLIPPFFWFWSLFIHFSFLLFPILIQFGFSVLFICPMAFSLPSWSCERTLFNQSTRLSSKAWIAGFNAVRGILQRRCASRKRQRRQVKQKWPRTKHDLWGWRWHFLTLVKKQCVTEPVQLLGPHARRCLRVSHARSAVWCLHYISAIWTYQPRSWSFE